MLNDPVNFIDPLGLAPGDPYPTSHDAAHDAVSDVNPTSISTSTEYAGMIYQNPDGTFSYTPPNRGSNDGANPGGPSSCPSGTTPTDYYHTHGSADPGYDNDNFSNADKDYGNHYNVDGYLGTPSGDLKHYDHSSGTISTIGKVPITP